MMGLPLAEVRAASAEHLLGNLEEENRQLRTALETRIVIEQAKGILHERFQLPLDMAFELLRASARNSRRLLHEIAAEVVASPITPDPIQLRLLRPRRANASVEVRTPEGVRRIPTAEWSRDVRGRAARTVAESRELCETAEGLASRAPRGVKYPLACWRPLSGTDAADGVTYELWSDASVRTVNASGERISFRKLRPRGKESTEMLLESLVTELRTKESFYGTRVDVLE